MKTLIALLLSGSLAIAQALPVTLAWSYTNSPAPDSFQVQQTTNAALPVASWPVLTNVPGTQQSVTLTVVPGAYYFTATASNFWGISPVSNIVTTPPPAVLPKSLTITR